MADSITLWQLFLVLPSLLHTSEIDSVVKKSGFGCINKHGELICAAMAEEQPCIIRINS